MTYVIQPLPQVTIPVAKTGDLFPIHRIYCVGRNYAEHAKEMGFTGREPPFFFMKPADALVPVADGTTGRMPYPSKTSDLHHEIELVVAIGKRGANIAAADAMQYVWGYAVGLDMTRRDLQSDAKKQGRPWEVGKAFDHSAPIGPLYPITETGPIDSGEIRLGVNGKPRQAGDISQLIWNVSETIEHLSSLFELQPGDLIYTGTPQGVAKVERGDVMEGRVAGLGSLRIEVV
jgi:fumarylpyruvate hydrolase